LKSANRNNVFVLTIIVLAQFLCTSLWFATNGVISEVVKNFDFTNDAVAHLTSAVQFGFIIGTLVYAVLTISDRYSPSLVFCISAIFSACFNIGIIHSANTMVSMGLLRFFTGFFLAGIYPVGMKIATDYFDKGLGKSLGYLVGALVVGTALPHLLSGLIEYFTWRQVIQTISILALIGGCLLFFLVPDGPYRKSSQHIQLSAFSNVFKNANFRAPAFGYFGHMWELYAFWTFVPLILQTYANMHSDSSLNIPMLSFSIIGIGGLACILSGYISGILGPKRTAMIAISVSGLFCLLSPLLFMIESQLFFLTCLFIWGMAVIADSPMFSTLVAQNADAEIKGTALTIVNCFGFAITILSIQLLNVMNSSLLNAKYNFMLLALGPLFGFLALRSNRE